MIVGRPSCSRNAYIDNEGDLCLSGDVTFDPSLSIVHIYRDDFRVLRRWLFAGPPAPPFRGSRLHTVVKWGEDDSLIAKHDIDDLPGGQVRFSPPEARLLRHWFVRL